MSRYIDSPNFTMPSRDMDPPSMTEAEEQELHEQIATERADLREAIMVALDEYCGEHLDMDDRRQIINDTFSVWRAKRLG